MAMHTLGPSIPAFLDEFTKLAGMSREEAKRSLEHLQQMQEQSRRGELVRAALVGAALMPVGGSIGRAIRGNTAPMTARHLAADMVGGAIAGGAIPTAKRVLEQNVEEERLKEYLAATANEPAGRTLHQKVTRALGV